MVEILEEHEAYPSALPGPARRIDHCGRGSPSRSAATTRARSASCRSCAVPRSAAAWATSSTRSRSSPPTACARSRCSARTSTPTAATSAPGSTARSSPTCCARSTRSTASSASASRRRTRRTSAPRRSPPWPSARRCASTCTSRCSRGATARWPACTAATPPSGTSQRLAGARAAIPDLAVTTDLIVGFPGETDADFERTLEVVDAAAYDAAYTFVFSPRPGTPAADMVDDFVAPEVAQERMRRLTEVVERHALAQARGAGRAHRGRCWSRARRRTTPTMWSGRTRQNKLVHFAAGGRTSRWSAAPPTVASPTPRRTGCGATSCASIPHARPARVRIPVTAAPAYLSS